MFDVIQRQKPLILSINPSNRTLTIKNQNHASVQSSSTTILPAHPLKSDLTSNLTADLSSELAVNYSFGLTNTAADLASPHRDLASPRRRSRQSSLPILPVLAADHAADLHSRHQSLVEFGLAF
nr:hypothetical protein CFP56_41734 [Quercus suber]